MIPASGQTPQDNSGLVARRGDPAPGAIRRILRNRISQPWDQRRRSRGLLNVSDGQRNVGQQSGYLGARRRGSIVSCHSHGRSLASRARRLPDHRQPVHRDWFRQWRTARIQQVRSSRVPCQVYRRLRRDIRHGRPGQRWDGVNDAFDNCPDDPNKSAAGQCGCGTPDTDSDNDGVADCLEAAE